MSAAAFHPSVLLFSWACLVIAGQTLQGLALLAALIAALGLAVLKAGSHCFRLIRRARYLLLTLAILFLCGTPGESLWPWAGFLSPTGEGLALALLHGGRLLLVLALLALLLEYTSAEMLVAGVFGLLAPFAWLPREKVALRLMLVLQYAEAQKLDGQRRSWREWLNWLDEPEADSDGQVVRLKTARLQGRDFLLILFVLAALFPVFLR